MDDIDNAQPDMITCGSQSHIFTKPVMITYDRMSGRIVNLKMEKDFWVALELIAKKEKLRLSEIFTAVHHKKGRLTLKNALKLFAVNYLLSDQVNSKEAQAVLDSMKNEKSGYKLVSHFDPMEMPSYVDG